MIDLPDSQKLPIGTLSCVFSNTTNSYKFYWFLAILDEIESTDSRTISFDNVFINMISSVIFPLEYYKLSFGKMDGFKELGKFIKEKVKLNFRPAAESLNEQIKTSLNPLEWQEMSKMINVLNRWVPYRFIRPFFSNETRGLSDAMVNKKVEMLAYEVHESKPHACPYFIHNEEITINGPWFNYFKENIGILRSFTYWHLVQFLQKNNPNVIGIAQKLFKPSIRNIKVYIDSWRLFLTNQPDVRCIYSEEFLPIEFSLDHFIPWSYVVNDSIWNLIPTTKSINSSKSDNLPSLKYLNPFINLQFIYFKFLLNSEYVKLQEEYCLLLHYNIEEIRTISEEKFSNALTETIKPLIQIAGNNGFQMDWIYQK